MRTEPGSREEIKPVSFAKTNRVFVLFHLHPYVTVQKDLAPQALWSQRPLLNSYHPYFFANICFKRSG